MTANCPNCGAPTRADQRFCRSCGTQVLRPCPNCNTLQSINAQSCENCHAAIGAPAATGAPTQIVGAAAPTQIVGTPSATNTPPAGRTNQQQPGRQPVAAVPQKSSAKPRAAITAFGLLVAAGVFAAVVLLLGGDDGTGGYSVVEARNLLAPDKFDNSSEDLASTIGNLNRAQLKMSTELQAAQAANGGLIGDPKVVDQGLKDVAAQAMRSAELANVLAETARSQDGASDTAAAMAGQYDAIARSGYSQVIELQALRDQYAAGLIGVAQIITVINFYGASLWNPLVTIEGVAGNPFIPWLDPGLVAAPVALGAPGITTVTGQMGGGTINVWISASAQVTNRSLTFDLSPLISTFDPYDPDLIVDMLTAEGQSNSGQVIRVILARLEQYSRVGGDVPVTLAGFASFQPDGGMTADLTDIERAGLLLGGLPRFGGRVNIGMALAQGLVLVDSTQVRASNVYSFPDGRSVMVVTQGTQPAPGLVLLGWQGGVSSLLGRLVLAQVSPFVSLKITNAEALYTGTTGAGPLLQGVYDVRVDMEWLSTVPFVIYCGSFQVDVQVPNGSLVVSLKEFRSFADGPPRLQCAAYYNNRLYGLAYYILEAGDPTVTTQQLAALDTYVNVYETQVGETRSQALALRVSEIERIEGERVAADQAAADQAAADAAAASAAGQPTRVPTARPAATATRVPPTVAAGGGGAPPPPPPPSATTAPPPPPPSATHPPAATATPAPKVVDEGTYPHNAAAATTDPLLAGKQYRVCLTGTIVVKTDAHGATAAKTAAQSFMTVAGVGVSAGNTGCVTLNGAGHGVTIKCDGTRFQNGNPYWGTVSGSWHVQVILLNP